VVKEILTRHLLNDVIDIVRQRKAVLGHLVACSAPLAMVAKAAFAMCGLPKPTHSNALLDITRRTA
jgi:hypothetical protein